MTHPPQYHDREAIYINAPQSVPVQNLTMSVVKVIGGAVGLVVLTASATWGWFSIQQAIVNLGTKVDSYMASTSHRIDKLEQMVEKRTAERWTRSDHNYWCSRTEQINADIGWRCAENPGEERIKKFAPPAPAVNGWRARATPK